MVCEWVVGFVFRFGGFKRLLFIIFYLLFIVEVVIGFKICCKDSI